MSELLLLNAGIRNARQELAELNELRAELLRSARGAKSWAERLEFWADAKNVKRDMARVRREIDALKYELDRARSDQYERDR